MTLRAHVLVIVRVVNELSPRCRSCEQNSKIHNPNSPLLLFANLHTLKRLSADSPSRPSSPPFLFLTIIFCVFGYLLLSLILNIYLSHTLRTSELKQWKLQQTLRLCGPPHLQKRLRNLLQHDNKIFKPCFIVTRSVSPMLSDILSMKIQWMTPLMNESIVIKVLLSHNYSNCSLSSLFICISNGACSCSSKLPSSLLLIQASSDSFSSSLWYFSYPFSSNACNIRSLTSSTFPIMLQFTVSPSNFRPTSPAPSVIGSLTRISLKHNPALFPNELEYLYTGKGFDDAFDTNEKNGSEGEADEARIAKVRKDIVYMWRSRLYSDIIIEIHEDVPTIGNSTTTEEETAPAFYSHRFILATRAPYFYDQLITYGLKNLPLLNSDYPLLLLLRRHSISLLVFCTLVRWHSQTEPMISIQHLPSCLPQTTYKSNHYMMKYKLVLLLK